MQLFFPYEGVAMAYHPSIGSVLFGAPADAFKAVKKLCQQESLPFPRILVAPTQLMANAVAQFAPEFFLYEFLFVYGAAYKPELLNERLLLIAPRAVHDGLALSLRHTLLGPSTDELRGYAAECPEAGLDPQTIADLSGQSAHLAIKQDAQIRGIDAMVRFASLDEGAVPLGAAAALQSDEEGFLLTVDGMAQYVHSAITRRVAPFCSLPPASEPLRPQTFGVVALGTRSGFDLSGPTTGFALNLAGRLVLFDGPPAVGELLETQGMSLRDVEGVIVSHCHEDHMPSIVELLLRAEAPKLWTAEPIYRSLLVKLSAYFRQPREDVARLLRYECVVPGKPVSILGAKLEFFYTAHSIPTLGVRASLVRQQQTYVMQISGDTLHHAGLDAMAKQGAIGAEHHRRLRHLIPDGHEANAIYFADCGGPPIHGVPQDWAGNSNRIIAYHCSALTEAPKPGQLPVVNAGDRHILCAAPSYEADVAACLADAMHFVELDSARWLTVLLHLGESHLLQVGAHVPPTTCSPGMCGVVIAGTLTLSAAPPERPGATLRPGDVFGTPFAHQLQATSQSTGGPARLLCWPTDTFMELVAEQGTLSACERQQALRAAVDRYRVFSSLGAAQRNGLCRVAQRLTVPYGERALEPQGPTRDLFLSVAGGWTGRQPNWPQPVSVPSIDFPFFNEARVLLGCSAPAPTITPTTSSASCLQFHGATVQHLAERFAGLRLELQRAIRMRQGKAGGLAENS